MDVVTSVRRQRYSFRITAADALPDADSLVAVMTDVVLARKIFGCNALLGQKREYELQQVVTFRKRVK